MEIGENMESTADNNWIREYPQTDNSGGYKTEIRPLIYGKAKDTKYIASYGKENEDY